MSFGFGNLPSLGGGINFGGNQSQMRPLGQMWPQQGQQPQGQQPGQFPQLGQFQFGQGQATPGGGGTGAPIQQGQLPSFQFPQQPGGFQMPQMPQFGGQFDQYHNAMQNYRDQRPQFAPGQRPADAGQQMQDWRATRPQFSGFGMNPFGG